MKYTETQRSTEERIVPADVAGEWVHLVRYLRNDHRPTTGALRLIAANTLTAQQRADGWWVQRVELEDGLEAMPPPAQTRKGVMQPMGTFIRTPEFPGEAEQLVNLEYVRAIEFFGRNDPGEAGVIARYGDGTTDWAPLARGGAELCNAAYEKLCELIGRGAAGQLVEWPDFWKDLVERHASPEN